MSFFNDATIIIGSGAIGLIPFYGLTGKSQDFTLGTAVACLFVLAGFAYTIFKPDLGNQRASNRPHCNEPTPSTPSTEVYIPTNKETGEKIMSTKQMVLRGNEKEMWERGENAHQRLQTERSSLNKSEIRMLESEIAHSAQWMKDWMSADILPIIENGTTWFPKTTKKASLKYEVDQSRYECGPIKIQRNRRTLTITMEQSSSAAYINNEE